MKIKLIFASIAISISTIVIFIHNIDTTKATTITLADVVIAKAGSCTSWQSGFSGVCQTNNHEYRYIGININNYVSFNNDLYRIVGVFDDNSTGVSGNLVKLTRARPIGSYSWGITNSSPDYTTYLKIDNNWAIANSKIILNEYFLNSTDTSITYGSCSNWTYYANNNNSKTEDCSKIVNYGIKTDNLRNYIQPVTWYLRGFDTGAYSKSDFYNCERGITTGDTNKDSKCNSANNGNYSATITNTKMGLIYASDYLYASGYFSYDDTTKGTSSANVIQNWLYTGHRLTITPTSNTSQNIIGINVGNVSQNSVSSPSGIYPTFYLKEQVYVTGGNGSFHNPYTIACDNCNS